MNPSDDIPFSKMIDLNDGFAQSSDPVELSVKTNDNQEPVGPRGAEVATVQAQPPSYFASGASDLAYAHDQYGDQRGGQYESQYGNQYGGQYNRQNRNQYGGPHGEHYRSDFNYGYDQDLPPGQASANQVVVMQPGSVHQTRQAETDVNVSVPMVLAVISVFFCTCIGIFSIVNASNAREQRAKGQYADARDSAKLATSTALIGIFIGAIATALLICVQLGVL